MKYYRSDQAAIHVKFAAITIDDESWSVLDGGDNVAPNKVVHPGGMAPTVALGGIPIRSDITVERAWSDLLFGAYKALDAASGIEPIEVGYVILNGPGKPQGTVFTYTGVLLSASRPGYKAGESNDAMLKLTVGPNGPIG
jgi:hypothetical protein